ncbi:catechol 2,3-dioxygenase [Pseudomonas indoloxydans]|uniref:Metapyrocatechase n=1 Tax=Ectopseudomonas oleovorans TaxID=301 RepID=A0A2T5PS73_ECTOL|nr:catechol 2,3-dioxygenase [Pseudomonas indoloxydans]PTU80567.1 catechol 2,3-dioxygenase [Pseudomonas indoloxydans]
MKKGVMRPGHIQLRVLDLEEALAYYRDLIGLIEVDRDEVGRVYLKGWTEVDKFSVVLREAETSGMDFVSFKCLNDRIVDDLRDELIRFGCKVQEMPANELRGCGRRIQFDSPTGHIFEIFSTKEQTGKWGISNTNPEAWPRGLKGMKATRFDHCLLYGPNIAGSIELFRNILGFDLSEQVIDERGTRLSGFLSIGMKAHDVAFIEHADPAKLHHVAFHLESWDDVLRAADLISMTDTALDAGPTRHGLTHGKTIYFFDPSGNRLEVFAGGDYHYPDHPPVTWTEDSLGKAVFYHSRALNERFLTVLT